MKQTLFRKDKNGAIREWSITVTGNKIVTEYGVFGGKMIVKTEIITFGKNIGRANETTKEEQAQLEAESTIRKKTDAGYTLQKPSFSVDKTKSKVIRPMLAHDYSKFSHKIKFPAVTQAKLDGYRLLYNPGIDKMTTRGNKEYTILYGTPLHKELQKFKVILDGELYIHDKNFNFENYGVLRKKVLKPEDKDKLESIKFNIFDIVMDGPFSERVQILNKIKNTKYIQVVQTEIVKSKTEIESMLTKYLKQGYEGAMVRNLDGKYSNSRSYDLLKYKKFDDAEFKVVGFKHEKLQDDGLKPVVWTCITADGVKFDVQSKGTREERHNLYIDGQKYIGKQLSVQFFGTTADNIPRFPKTLREGKASFRT